MIGDVIHQSSNGAPDDGVAERLSLGVAARLSRYLQVLTQAKKMGQSSISSQDVSEYTHINATQIRRDLSNFGKFGKQGKGYDVRLLNSEIHHILRLDRSWNVALVGYGNLGQAIVHYGGFVPSTFHIAAICAGGGLTCVSF